MKCLAVVAVALALSLAACNRPSEQEPVKALASPPEQAVQQGPPVAHFLFAIPPPDPKYPEREIFTAAFSQAAGDAFPAANWEYREIRLYEKPTTEWQSIMRRELNSYPTVVFSYHDVYSHLFVKLSETFEVRPSNYVLALASMPPEASSLFFRLDLRMEEPGFIAGVALAHLSRTGRLAAVSFEEDWCDRYVAGFTQGVREVRAGASITDFRVNRRELVRPEEGTELILGMLNKVQERSSSGLGIDGVAILASALGESIISSLRASSSSAVQGLTPLANENYRSVVFSTVLDLSRLPLFFVENANDIGLFKIDQPVRLNEGVQDSPYMPKPGRRGPTGGVKVISIGMSDGVLKLEGISQHQNYGELPDDVAEEIWYYERAIIAGEIPISTEPLTE